MLSEEEKVKVAARLKRIAGQVTGIEKMIDDERYCVDILTQISATRAALGKVSALLLEEHINHCVRGALGSDDAADREAKIAELIKIFDKNCNC